MTREQQMAIRRAWGRCLLILKTVNHMLKNEPTNQHLLEQKRILETDAQALKELISKDETSEPTS